MGMESFGELGKSASGRKIAAADFAGEPKFSTIKHKTHAEAWKEQSVLSEAQKGKDLVMMFDRDLYYLEDDVAQFQVIRAASDVA